MGIDAKEVVRYDAASTIMAINRAKSQ